MCDTAFHLFSSLHFLSVSVPVSILHVDIDLGWWSSSCNLMRIGGWSELSVDKVCEGHEMMRKVDVNEHLSNSALRLAVLSWGNPS